MHMSETVKARHDLAIAEAHVKFVARRVSEPECSDQEKFKLIWNLAFLDLRMLESHRCPE